MIKFIAFISLLNLLIGISILLGADLGTKKLVMFEREVDPVGNTVALTPIYAYSSCHDCKCKNK
jgi:hypothetical protein